MDGHEHFLNHVHGFVGLKAMTASESVDRLLIVVLEKGPSVSIVPIG
jgi:hypothetical protein